MVSQLMLGFHDAVRGAGFVARHPRLWFWVIAPALLAAVILIAAVTSAVGLLRPLVDSVLTSVPGWVETLAQAVITFVLGLLSLSLCLSVATIIAGPFNEMLSERIEEQVTGRGGDRFRVGRFLVDATVGVLHAIRRVVAYLLTVLLLLLLSVVPVVGAPVAAAIGLVVTARFASYDAYDAVWARRRWRYRDKIAGLRQRRWRSLGLCAAIAAMVLVPVLNLLALSFGAAGATLAIVDEERERGASAAPPSALSVRSAQ